MKKIEKHVEIEANSVVAKAIEELQKEDEETYNRLIDRLITSETRWLKEVLKEALKENL